MSDEECEYEYGSKILGLHKFNPHQLLYNDKGERIYVKVCLIGKSSSGKSYCLRRLMYELYRDRVPCGVVVALTDQLTHYFSEFVPEPYIRYKWNERIIPKLLKRQQIIQDKNRERIKLGKKPLDDRAFLVMDDCQKDKKKWINDDNILTIFYQIRHFKITFFITLQYSKGLTTDMRTNIDFVFLFGEEIYANKDRLYKDYAGIFPSFKVFTQVFDQITDDYGCMVLDMKARVSDIKKKVFYYRASKPPPFMIGDKRFITWALKHYNKNYNKETRNLNSNDLVNKKNTIIVKVKKE